MGVLVQGVRLELNGATVLEEPLLVHGNDGSAQYHVAMPGLVPGVYELRASLMLTRMCCRRRTLHAAPCTHRCSESGQTVLLRTSVGTRAWDTFARRQRASCFPHRPPCPCRVSSGQAAGRLFLRA